uniref:LAGLIDADG homing endonuclease n=1 Tax=Blastosporella zonata TaxID=530045 RepID=A0A386TY09_9AGAR|nr:LAGLIDADG homing endonuclease [Blastosporella zonata]YP_009517208.1 LAGLIDADG homing endonuclease [Blastosporella zonata]AYE93103.1 LAGLIDADG homing endonuclease [Blastosporella zonata]AYE93106.1 LAGLIDADG homing endonuclease [Blastosporella zonata]
MLALTFLFIKQNIFKFKQGANPTINKNLNIKMKIINNKYIYYKNNFCRNYRTSAKAHLEVNPQLEEIIVGSMLGDLSAERRNLNSNTRLQIKQSNKNREYVYHLYSLFEEFCGSKPLVMSNFDSRPNKMKEYTAIKFQTLSLPCFNKYREMFYANNGVKIIPQNLESLLTTRGLAYWIMDDGYKSNKGFYICTESFSLGEHEVLINILRNKFELECSYHKTTNGPRLYIFSSSRDKLLELIKPYLLTHFFYKFKD